jgi:Helicase conserved C-terminal domain
VLMRRLRERGWGHLLFHGGVPGEQRGALVDRFLNDPDCRLFLSTDAGGVGLNLQHAAATVFNMDLPWNPAVLEQRIGRVHRMGQQRGVQAINFVAQGSIEEGMLSVLAFKKSLFAGVLDGGDSAVFMQGTRLAKFMESVDEVTGAMGAAEEVAEVPVPVEASEAAPEAEVAPPTAAPPVPDPWAPLVEAGLQLVQTLADASRHSDSKLVQVDETTGQRYLKLPLPEPAAVQRLAEGLAGLLAGLRR